MNILKHIVATALVLAAFAAPGTAKSVWDQINETAPLHPIFDTMKDTGP